MARWRQAILCALDASRIQAVHQDHVGDGVLIVTVIIHKRKPRWGQWLRIWHVQPGNHVIGPRYKGPIEINPALVGRG